MAVASPVLGNLLQRFDGFGGLQRRDIEQALLATNGEVI
jgi:hypothetical protein